MEDDNSCLFRAVGYALSKDVGRAQELRESKYKIYFSWRDGSSAAKRKSAFSAVAAAIQSDPINYPEAILG